MADHLESFTHHFGKQPANLKWVHRLNSAQFSLADGVDFIEADVFGIVTADGLDSLDIKEEAWERKDDGAYASMGHDLDAIKENHPLPFSVWLDGLLAYLENQRPPACGIKVDMKNIECVESVLGSLKKRVTRLDSLKLPLILNADVCSWGPVCRRVPGCIFVQKCMEYFPDAVLSLGWSTCRLEDGSWGDYSAENVDEMLGICKNLANVTFAVRAIMIVSETSILELNRLLANCPNSSLSVWNHSTDGLTPDNIDRIKSAYPCERLMLDLLPPSV